jgi:hypothetical protein
MKILYLTQTLLAKAEFEYLYDKPYEDRKAGCGTLPA